MKAIFAIITTIFSEESFCTKVIIRPREVHDEISGVEAQSKFFGFEEGVDQYIGIGCCSVSNVGRSRENC